MDFDKLSKEQLQSELIHTLAEHAKQRKRAERVEAEARRLWAELAALKITGARRTEALVNLVESLGQCGAVDESIGEDYCDYENNGACQFCAAARITDAMETKEKTAAREPLEAQK